MKTFESNAQRFEAVCFSILNTLQESYFLRVLHNEHKK